MRVQLEQCSKGELVCPAGTEWCHINKSLQYFAGGLPYDIMMKFGVSHSSIFDCVWIVVEAINSVSAMTIEYPSDVEEQKKTARGFCNASKVKFGCCAGAVDGILIWMHKPSMKEADATGVSQKKFLCK